MSLPILSCWVCHACNGNEDMFNRIVERLDYNSGLGIFAIFPCECDPPCPKPTDEELEKFHKRATEAVTARRKERSDKQVKSRKIPPGAFEKFIGPVIKKMVPSYE